ncbi:LacI family DNA-binding transcriptional regulator [Microlunatus flavus]|uniref:LacI family transcriptional regulator n=1 Tax=Microlunatus flavus TaxID=1036181 RepID=A0A1H9G1P6_9ACTN|nr:LacI family DNA-binding transcriptional regulator [Microlunatus flavus]SEQ43863.1 LacI family transcriptional regulator [Microlunatus flavus]
MSAEQRGRTTAVTLVEVARHAGVSLATASRVLNGSGRTPAAAIADRVRAAAAELRYVPNAQAQALARSATRLLGVVVHDIADPYFSTIIGGAQRAARLRGRQVLLAAAERDEGAEREAVAAFVAHRTDAIVLAGSRRTHTDDQLSAELGRYVERGGRVLTLGPSAIPGALHLDVGNREGGAELVRALVARGLTRFVVLSGPPELQTVQDRIGGYREAMEEAGLTPLAVVEDVFTSTGGHRAATQAWEQLRWSEPVCLLAVNDVMALGAITALRGLGLSVPGDAQVAGFDDIPTLRDHAPALTTYRLPLERIGERAVELALSGEATHERLGGEVVIRESAGSAARSPAPTRV